MPEIERLPRYSAVGNYESSSVLCDILVFALTWHGFGRMRFLRPQVLLPTHIPMKTKFEVLCFNPIMYERIQNCSVSTLDGNLVACHVTTVEHRKRARPT